MQGALISLFGTIVWWSVVEFYYRIDIALSYLELQGFYKIL